MEYLLKRYTTKDTEWGIVKEPGFSSPRLYIGHPVAQAYVADFRSVEAAAKFIRLMSEEA